MIVAHSLYSGSSGNAYLIKSGSTAILVDAGKSCAALCRALRAVGTEPEEISAVLITHEHTDHVSALRVFHKKYGIPMIGTAPVLGAVCENDGMCDCARALRPGKEFALGDVAVSSHATSHDSAASVCYRFRTADGDSLVIATDMGEVTPECTEFLSGATFAVIEANHDPGMLRTGPYSPGLKSRIASRFGHLSNGQCAELAVRLAESGTAGFLLAHLSRENNTPAVAVGTVSSTLAEAGFGDVPLRYAYEECPVRVVIESGKCEICPIDIEGG